MEKQKSDTNKELEMIDYLKKNWHAIDAVKQPLSPDGRLDKEKIFLKYLEQLSNGATADALMLEAIFERYNNLCLAFKDGYIDEEEPLLGISEEDVSIYEQQLNGVSKEQSSPNHWRLPKAEVLNDTDVLERTR